MDSRQDSILIPEILFAILAGSIVFWRVYTNVVLKRTYRLADLLIFLAVVSDLIALSCSSLSTRYGLGKHIYDPSVEFSKAMRFIYYGEATNLISMLLAKLSIAAFLLYLDFANGYKILMWMTVGIVLLCNGGVAMTSIFASCHPISMNWDTTGVGSCWPRKFNQICTYVQSGSNILTDLIFTSVPIFYLSTVRLGRNVQWGLRLVLLFGLIATICSVVKIAVAGKMFTTSDPTWDAVDLTIWSTAEVNVCIIAACLPPLRSQFDNFLQRCFGRSLTGSSTRSRSRNYTNSIALQSKLKSNRTIVDEHQDDGSELYILPARDGGEDGIRKTIQVQVRDDGHRSYSVR